MHLFRRGGEIGELGQSRGHVRTRQPDPCSEQSPAPGGKSSPPTVDPARSCRPYHTAQQAQPSAPQKDLRSETGSLLDHAIA
jgi:hypothetical protein